MVDRSGGRRVEAVDATAAGDTIVGYLACGIAEGLSFANAVTLSNAATLSVAVMGAQPAIPKRAAVERLLRSARDESARR